MRPGLIEHQHHPMRGINPLIAGEAGHRRRAVTTAEQPQDLPEAARHGIVGRPGAAF